MFSSKIIVGMGMKLTERILRRLISISIVRAPPLFPGYIGRVWLTSSLLLDDLYSDDDERSLGLSPPRDTDMLLDDEGGPVAESDLEADDERSPMSTPPRDTALTNEANPVAESDSAVEAVITAAGQNDESPGTVWLAPTTNHPENLVKMLNYIYRENCSDFQWSLTKANGGKHIWFVTSNCCSRTLL